MNTKKGRVTVPTDVDALENLKHHRTMGGGCDPGL